MRDDESCRIDVRVASIRHLFNSMDPSPFVERELDADAEEFVLDWAMETPRARACRLVVHLDDVPTDPALLDGARTGVRNHFAYRADVLRLAFSR